MKRRSKSSPRLDWRDPAMPVIRNYRMPNGTRKVEVDPDYEQRYREFLISSTAEPSYRKDPTYNLRKPK